MRRNSLIIVTALLGISLALPATGHGRWYGGWGWYGPGVFAGGVVLGAVIARPWYYAPPPPVYVYPRPVYVYPPPPPVYFPNQAYAYPDPALTSRQGSKPSSGSDGGSKSGQWVEVPGQSINGRWVPSHKVWVPGNP